MSGTGPAPPGPRPGPVGRQGPLGGPPGTPPPVAGRRLIPVGGQRSRPGGEALPVVNVYDAVGGQPFFDDLVDRFYQGVEGDPLLRPLYPDDLAAPRRRLALFLGQYWGGPTTYSDERGHPRLRLRHARFTVRRAERDAWLRHMRAAVDAVVAERHIHPAIEARMLDYFGMAAEGLVNTP